MNNKSDTSFENQTEGEKCKINIYQVLSHIAIFVPLMTSVFPQLGDVGSRDKRKEFLEDEENLKIILEYFKDENNLKKFAEEVVRFYGEHKEALDIAGIDESHKNMYSIAIATIGKFNKDKEIENSHVNADENLSNVSIETGNLIENLNKKFNFILEQLNQVELERARYGNIRREILGDIEGNLAEGDTGGEGHIMDFLGTKIAKVAGRYIDVNTRKPIIVSCDGAMGYLKEIDRNQIIKYKPIIRSKDGALFTKIDKISTQVEDVPLNSIFKGKDNITHLVLEITKFDEGKQVALSRKSSSCKYSIYVEGTEFDKMQELKDSEGRSIVKLTDIIENNGHNYIRVLVDTGKLHEEVVLDEELKVQKKFKCKIFDKENKKKWHRN